jgi:dTDP-4-amino-4,6-dideoxy-D-galactose acyltransferase
MEFQLLDWDSSLLGKKVAKIKSNITSCDQLKQIVSMLRNKEVKLAYYESQIRLPYEVEQEYNGKIVDIKTTYFTKYKHNNDITLCNNIRPYESSIPISNMIRLAIQSGKYSRFNVDPNFPKNKFIAIYSIWIKKSIYKELAKEVLVYLEDNSVVGMITLGEKNNRGDIGLIAVDKNYRGKGYGKSLVRAAQIWFINNGYQTGQVITQGNNISACKLYSSCGYSVEKKTYFYHFWL